MIPLHPTAELLISRLQISSPQSLLLSGASGVGLLTIARQISDSQDVTIVSPDETKASRPIATDAIRHLYETTRSKSDSRQYVIVHEADAMTHSAQGAFLKLLEEPNSSIHFILTSSQPDVLLPTIRSRVQHHTIPSITREQTEQYITELGVKSDTIRRQLIYIAEGLPEELSRLVTDKNYFEESAQQMKDARDLLQAPLYQKLLVINGYRENRAKAQQLIQFAINMARRSLADRPQTSLITQLSKLLETSERLEANANVRLALTRLVL